MASPTLDEVIDQLKIIPVQALERLREVASEDTPSLVSLEDAAQAALKGDYMTSALAEYRRTVRAAVSAALEPNVVRGIIQLAVLEAARAIGSPARRIYSAAEDLVSYMVKNNLHVPSRNLTLGTPSADGGNTGDGEYSRLTVDEHGNTLEGVFLEAKEVVCVNDQNSTTIHQEVFELRGEAAEVDFLRVAGSGMGRDRPQDRFVAIDALLTANYVQNPSWDQHGVGADNTAFSSGTAPSGWQIANDWANVKARSGANAYRGSQGIVTPWAIELTASDTVSQILRNTVRPRFAQDRSQPYRIRVKVKRKGSATGTARLDFGAASATLDLGTVNNDEWQTLEITGKDCYYENFKANDLAVKVGVSTLAVGTVVFDDLNVAPYTFLDGTWHAITGGPTPFLAGDRFAFSDELAGAEDAVIQYWWAFRSGLPTLPHVSPAAEVEASGGRTLTFADSDPDTITASSGSFVSDGYKPGMRLTVSGTSSNDGVYVIDSVTATVITLAAGEELASEGPLSSAAKLNATAYYPDP